MSTIVIPIVLVAFSALIAYVFILQEELKFYKSSTERLEKEFNYERDLCFARGKEIDKWRTQVEQYKKLKENLSLFENAISSAQDELEDISFQFDIIGEEDE